MALREIDKKIYILTENWIAITKFEAPIEWGQWIEFRKANLGCILEPDTLTVPSDFPPSTQQAKNQYLEIVREIRKSIGWTPRDRKAKH